MNRRSSNQTRAGIIGCLTGFVLLACPLRLPAYDFPWDGKTYIPVGLQERADTVLIFPEAVEPVWSEEPSLIQKVRVNATTLVLNPKVGNPEQRLFAIGRSSNTIYVARLSTELRYYPTVTVSNGPRELAQRVAQAPALDEITLARAMMRDERPPGFARTDSNRVLLEGNPYRITATELWSSPQLSGILGELSRSAGTVVAQFIPRNLVLRIPQLGVLRFVGADRYDLSPDHPTTRVYLVFGR
jgi:hypothetical protein